MDKVLLGHWNSKALIPTNKKTNKKEGGLYIMHLHPAFHFQSKQSYNTDKE